MRNEASLYYKRDEVKHSNQSQGCDKEYLYWKFSFIALNIENEGKD